MNRATQIAAGNGSGAAAVTAADIARMAGLSTGTVYMVLRHDPRVAAPTRARVLDLIERFHYRPRASARALAGGRTQAVGLVFAYHREPDLIYTRFASLLRACSEAAVLHDQHLHIAAWDAGNPATALPQNIILPPRLEVRGSTAAAPGSG